MDMALKKIVDDTIITEDTGENRMYLQINDTLRLRSHDTYQVVLEQKKDKWTFQGYFPQATHLFATAQNYKTMHANWGRKLNRPDGVEQAMPLYFEVYAPLIEACLNKAEVEKFIKEAKEYEFNKKSDAYSNRTGLRNNI